MKLAPSLVSHASEVSHRFLSSMVWSSDWFAFLPRLLRPHTPYAAVQEGHRKKHRIEHDVQEEIAVSPAVVRS